MNVTSPASGRDVVHDVGRADVARRAYSIPMRTRFRGITNREGLLLNGPAGWGEFSPFLDYDAPECVPWLRAAHEAAFNGFPANVREEIPVNVTVPAVGPERAEEIVRDSGGCTTAKVKIAEPGQSRKEEKDRLAAVRNALGPNGKIRIDANAAWDQDTAINAITELNRAAGGLEYVEQPCPTVPELAAVRRRVTVPIAADESIRRAEDPFEVVRANAADVVVLKVQPLGGVRACLELAEAIGIPVVVSSALETSVGLAAGVALAAALPQLPHACGLATAHLLTSDVVDSPLKPVNGAITVARPPANETLLETVTDDVHKRWDDRLTATLHAMTQFTNDGSVKTREK